MFRLLVVVALGGVVGAVTRAVLELTFPHTPTGFPWATFVINVMGCLLLGALVAALTLHRPHQVLIRPFFGAGVLGGYTTFSTHMVEVVGLVEHDRLALALLYLAVQLGGGVLAAALGEWLVTRR